MVGEVKPGAGGRYSITLPEPTGAPTAVYRTTTLARQAGSQDVFKTYSLEQLAPVR